MLFIFGKPVMRHLYFNKLCLKNQFFQSLYFEDISKRLCKKCAQIQIVRLVLIVEICYAYR